MKTVLLLSGGLDSSTVLAIAVKEGFKPYAISFRYGQRHKVELDAASHIAKSFNLEQHIIIDIDLRQFGGSALTDNIDVPKERSEEQAALNARLKKDEAPDKGAAGKSAAGSKDDDGTHDRKDTEVYKDISEKATPDEIPDKPDDVESLFDD